MVGGVENEGMSIVGRDLVWNEWYEFGYYINCNLGSYYEFIVIHNYTFRADMALNVYYKSMHKYTIEYTWSTL